MKEAMPNCRISCEPLRLFQGNICQYFCQSIRLEIKLINGIHPSTFSNIFSSETTGPIELKYHKTPQMGKLLVVHVTKMAAMPIYVKNP